MVSWGLDYWGMVSRGGMSHNWGMVSRGGVNSVSHNRGSMSHQRSSVDSMMGHRVSGVSEDWGVGNSVVDRGHRVEGDYGGLANGDGSVGAQGGLDLGESLGVVNLGHRSVGGTEGLGLDEASLFTVGGGDRLVRSLASSDSHDRGVMREEDGAGGEGGGGGQEGETRKCLY